MRIYRVYDAKTERFGRLFAEHTDASARRAFTAAVADPNLPFHVAPGDYSLWMVAEEDDLSGVVMGEAQPIHVMQGEQAANDLARGVVRIIPDVEEEERIDGASR